MHLERWNSSHGKSAGNNESNLIPLQGMDCKSTHVYKIWRKFVSFLLETCSFYVLWMCARDIPAVLRWSFLHDVFSFRDLIKCGFGCFAWRNIVSVIDLALGGLDGCSSGSLLPLSGQQLEDSQKYKPSKVIWDPQVTPFWPLTSLSNW